LDETAPVTIGFAGGRLESVESAEMVTGSNAQVCNTYEQPRNVHSQPFKAVQLQNGKAIAELPPLSVAVLTFKIATPET
jgi:alpha-L-arabinofuranosidase